MQDDTKKETKIFDKYIKLFVSKIPLGIKPDHITYFRLILVFVLAMFFLMGNYLISFVVFVFASATDAIDGALARHREEYSEIGAALDPLIDKVLVIAIVLLFAKFIPLHIIIILTLVELFFVYGAYIFNTKKIQIKSNIWGKLKMNSEILALVLGYIMLIWNIDLLQIIISLLYLAILFAILAFFRHLKDYKSKKLETI